jgi:hypothetical protein
VGTDWFPSRLKIHALAAGCSSALTSILPGTPNWLQEKSSHEDAILSKHYSKKRVSRAVNIKVRDISRKEERICVE